jgi:hypothetical protein
VKEEKENLLEGLHILPRGSLNPCLVQPLPSAVIQKASPPPCPPLQRSLGCPHLSHQNVPPLLRSGAAWILPDSLIQGWHLRGLIWKSFTGGQLARTKGLSVPVAYQDAMLHKGPETPLSHCLPLCQLQGPRLGMHRPSACVHLSRLWTRKSLSCDP